LWTIKSRRRGEAGIKHLSPFSLHPNIQCQKLQSKKGMKKIDQINPQTIPQKTEI
jgi:hypothetical protein